MTSQIGAIHVGFRLNLALIHAIQLENGKSTGPTTFQHHRPLVLDSTLMMWQHFKRWTTGPDKHPLHDDIVALYLGLLEAIVFPRADPENDFCSSLKAAQALTSSLDGLLGRSSTIRLSEGNQTQLASCFTHLYSILKSSPPDIFNTRRRQNVTRISTISDLDASVARICQHVEHFSSFCKDLQVRVSRHPLVHY